MHACIYHHDALIISVNASDQYNYSGYTFGWSPFYNYSLIQLLAKSTSADINCMVIHSIIILCCMAGIYEHVTGKLNYKCMVIDDDITDSLFLHA